jgi:hypothetical protein
MLGRRNLRVPPPAFGGERSTLAAAAPPAFEAEKDCESRCDEEEVEEGELTRPKALEEAAKRIGEVGWRLEYCGKGGGR